MRGGWREKTSVAVPALSSRTLCRGPARLCRPPPGPTAKESRSGIFPAPGARTTAQGVVAKGLPQMSTSHLAAACLVTACFLACLPPVGATEAGACFVSPGLHVTGHRYRPGRTGRAEGGRTCAVSAVRMGKGDEGGGGVFGGFGGMLLALRKRAEKELRADPDSAFSRMTRSLDSSNPLDRRLRNGSGPDGYRRMMEMKDREKRAEIEARVETIIMKEDPTIAAIKGKWKESGRSELIAGGMPEASDPDELEKDFLVKNEQAMTTRPTESFNAKLENWRQKMESEKAKAAQAGPEDGGDADDDEVDDETDKVRLREEGYGNFMKAGTEVNIAFNWLQQLRGKQPKKGAPSGKAQNKGQEEDFGIAGLGGVFKAMRARREQAVRTLADEASVRELLERASSFASSEDWAKAGQALIDAEQRAKRAGSSKLTRQVSRVRGEVEDLVLDEGESLAELNELIEKQRLVLRNAQGGDGKSLQFVEESVRATEALISRKQTDVDAAREKLDDAVLAFECRPIASQGTGEKELALAQKASRSAEARVKDIKFRIEGAQGGNDTLVREESDLKKEYAASLQLVNSWKEEVKRREADDKGLVSELEDAKNSLKVLESELEELQSALSSANKRLSEVSSESSGKVEKLRELEARLDKARSKVNGILFPTAARGTDEAPRNADGAARGGQGERPSGGVWEVVRGGEQEFLDCVMRNDAAGVRSLFETISEDTVLMERLLGYGAEPRQTALHIAAKMGHRDTVIVLLSAGSNRGAKDEKGRSAADLAKECGHQDIESWLTVTPGK